MTIRAGVTHRGQDALGCGGWGRVKTAPKVYMMEKNKERERERERERQRERERGCLKERREGEK